MSAVRWQIIGKDQDHKNDQLVTGPFDGVIALHGVTPDLAADIVERLNRVDLYERHDPLLKLLVDDSVASAPTTQRMLKPCQDCRMDGKAVIFCEYHQSHKSEYVDVPVVTATADKR